MPDVNRAVSADRLIEALPRREVLSVSGLGIRKKRIEASPILNQVKKVA